MSYYVHNVPGRLRVKTPLVKRNRTSANHVEGLMKQLTGVKSTAVNTATGSIVVYHCPKTISCDAILNTLENKFLFKSVVENALKTVGLSFVAALI
jgi:hypothetical protein